jgi:sterol desaturase/sphingolipid hydroxylase (fatty acid hydroxylase superfamily)
LHQLAVVAAELRAILWQFVTVLFLTRSQGVFVLSLASALALAVVFLLWRRVGRERRLRPRTWLRALFPRRWLFGPSARADLGLLLFNTATFTVLFGWTLLSAHVVANTTIAALTRSFGTHTAPWLPAPFAVVVMTAAMFLAYEFGYWVDHYTKHNVAFLWEFHKVHHTAETLSPLTNFRMHPVDSIIFGNILALTLGVSQGALYFALGGPIDALTFWGANIVGLIFSFTIGHLQHSHIWMPIRGFWGRILLSPAHHQIHHSDNPAHFGTNLGSCLSLFDTLFGTLSMPPARRPKLTFGITPSVSRAHSVTGTLVAPFIESFAVIRKNTAVGNPVELAQKIPAAQR